MAKKEPSKAEVRVLVAKDVLKMLKSKRIKAQRGTYLIGDKKFQALLELLSQKEINPYWTKLDVTKQLPVPKACTACALGSCFIAALDRFNELKIGEFELYGRYPMRESYTGYLEQWFTRRQLNLIECAFEGGGRICEAALSPEDAHAAIRFRSNILADDVRGARAVLEAIMENIVNNKGTFKPKQEKKDENKLHKRAAKNANSTRRVRHARI